MAADGFGAKLGTPAGKLAIQGIVVLAAAGGWVLAPSVRPVVKGVSAAVCGVAGFVARKKLVAMRREAASGVLAKLLSSKGVSGVSLAEVTSLATSYGVPESEVAPQLARLLGVYMQACVRSPTAKTSELSDLLTLRRTFNLGFDTAGDAAFEVAGRFYSEWRAYFQAEEEHESKAKLDKLIFLCDRLLSEDPSEEGFRYERTRIAKKFGFNDQEWSRRVEKVGMPFFRELLAKVSKDPRMVSPKDLAAMGKQLGLSEGTSASMKLDELKRVVNAALDASGAKFTSSQLERTKALTASLGVSDAQYREVVDAAVSPAYAASVAEAMAELESAAKDNSAMVLGKLAVRQQELDLSMPAATKLEKAAAQQRVAKLIASALQNLRSGNTREAAEQLSALAQFSDRLIAMVKGSGKASDDSAVLMGYLDASARGCTQTEATQLYRVFILGRLESQRAESDGATLGRLRLLLGLSVSEADQAYEESATPLYRAKLSEVSASGALSEEDATALRTLASKLQLPAETVAKANTACYRALLTEKAGEGRIPSEADEQALEKLRAFLALPAEALEAVHVAVCSTSYANSVKEVMGASGVIGDEFWAGLQKLQARLRLPDETAEELYLVEAKRVLKAFGGRAIEAMASSLQKEAEAAKDATVKLDMNARATVVAEAAKIIDFVRAARLLVTTEEGAQFAKVSLKGVIDPKGLREFYRQFLLECFQGEGSFEKLFGQTPLLGQLLGLSEGETSAIQLELGSSIFRNTAMKALTERGNLNDDDRTFLASVREALRMDEALCDNLLVEMKKMRVSLLVERMFDSSAVSPAAVAKVRETAESFGLELVRDLQLPQQRLLRMLQCEVEAAIAAGECPPEDPSRLQELQEAYGLPQAAVSKELESLIERRSAGHLLQAASALRRELPEQVLSETEMLLRFNSLMPYKVKSNAVQKKELEEILMRYQSSCLKDGPLTDASRTKLGVLRTALGLAEVNAL